jgi:asparagine synthase (glutamine-hydrolysing)
MSAFVVVIGHSPEWMLGRGCAWDRAVGCLRERWPGARVDVEADKVRVAFAGGAGGVFEQGHQVVVVDGTPWWKGKPLIARHGIDVGCLPDVSGEFALCGFDRASGKVMLVRDRFGARPLYYAVLPGIVVASSECKSILPFLPQPGFSRTALLETVRFRWVVGREHVISPIRQVGSATVVELTSGGEELATRYWQIPFKPKENGDPPDLYTDALHDAFRRFFRRRDLKSRPVGILLSGGVDSSVVAAVAKEECPGAVAYVGRLPGDPNHETRRAHIVAQHLSMMLNVVNIAEGRLGQDLRQVVRRMEEPPRHPNNLVLMQLYERMARDGMEVVLTGDGAEMLLGLADTRRVGMFKRKRQWVRRTVPAAPRRFLAGMLERSDSSLAWRLGRVLKQDTLEYALTLDEVEYCRAIKRILRDARAGMGMDRQYSMRELFGQYADFEEGLQSYQTYTFLQSLLIRHDRLTQPLGLECIAPFLSEELVDFACQLPRALRYTTTSRPVLKHLCDRIAHPDVTRWEKLGFPVPWRGWMSGPLAHTLGTAADYGDISRVLPGGFVEAAFRHNDGEALWTIMTMRLMAEEFDLPARSRHPASTSP